MYFSNGRAVSLQTVFQISPSQDLLVGGASQQVTFEPTGSHTDGQQRGEHWVAITSSTLPPPSDEDTMYQHFTCYTCTSKEVSFVQCV